MGMSSSLSESFPRKYGSLINGKYYVIVLFWDNKDFLPDLSRVELRVITDSSETGLTALVTFLVCINLII